MTGQLEVTGYVSFIYGGTRLLAVDPTDPFKRVVPVHPDRLTEDRGIVVRCNCASVPPTLGTERGSHLSTCPLSLAIFSSRGDEDRTMAETYAEKIRAAHRIRVRYDPTFSFDVEH